MLFCLCQVFSCCMWDLFLQHMGSSSLTSDQTWQSRVFTGRTEAEAETPILWPPDAKTWLIWKDPDAGKDWGQEEKGMTEDETDVWRRNRHESGWTPGVSDGQGGLACCSSCLSKSQTWLSGWTELNWTLHWKCRVLATGPPGKPHIYSYIICILPFHCLWIVSCKYFSKLWILLSS